MPPEGFLLACKPRGASSFSAIGAARRALGVRRIGHAGTLDRQAEGLLVLGVGRAATRRLGELLACQKTYEADIALGRGSPSHDLGTIASPAPLGRATEKDAILAAAQALFQQEWQVPPVFSALKIDGKRASDRSRKGETLEMKPRPAKVHRGEILEIAEENSDHSPALRVRVRLDVAGGFYVRAFARDLGTALGTAGMATRIFRTRVGPFGVEDVCAVADISSEKLLPVEALPPS